MDGQLDEREIQDLQNWIEQHKHLGNIAGIPYLDDILRRISSDGLIDQDEKLQLHLAIERVVPVAHRTAIVQARKKQEAEAQRGGSEISGGRSERNEAAQAKGKIRHAFAKVAGVSFPNDDGTERQSILKKCRVEESLELRHEPANSFSSYATKVLRSSGEQLGYVPEYLAERLFRERKAGFQTVAYVKELTGGTPVRPTRGANFVVFIYAQGVTTAELSQYARTIAVSENIRSVDLSTGRTPPPVASLKPKPWWKFW